MSSNEPDADGSRGSILLVASTSGYFGGTGVVSYIASKHGVMGLLRASQSAAQKHAVRINAVAPFVTPTHITEGYSSLWAERGLPANTVEDVAKAIVDTAVDRDLRGACCMVSFVQNRLGEALMWTF
jgi:NAD(P)-dependent dehydrogenase (short-subunit alcohol dehydrogenase family)